MTKLELALREAEALPEEVREELGDQLLHRIHKMIALRDDLEIGLAELDAGLGLDGKTVFAELKAKYGA